MSYHDRMTLPAPWACAPHSKLTHVARGCLNIYVATAAFTVPRTHSTYRTAQCRHFSITKITIVVLSQAITKNPCSLIQQALSQLAMTPYMTVSCKHSCAALQGQPQVLELPVQLVRSRYGTPGTPAAPDSARQGRTGSSRSTTPAPAPMGSLEHFLGMAGQLFGRDPKKWERLGDEKVASANNSIMAALLQIMH